MAVAHINFNKGTEHGHMLFSALDRLEQSFTDLNEVHRTMALMIDGDGSSATHFTYMQEKFGFTDNAGAKAAYDELSSVLAKLNTDASVSSVNAALLQTFNKFR